MFTVLTEDGHIATLRKAADTIVIQRQTLDNIQGTTLPHNAISLSQTLRTTQIPLLNGDFDQDK
jgi:hypothetical protein